MEPQESGFNVQLQWRQRWQSGLGQAAEQGEKSSTLGICGRKEHLQLRFYSSDFASDFSATAQFSWRQVMQALINNNPGLFGVLEEPLHHVFADALIEMGFEVPGFPPEDDDDF
ncbi:MAG: hypothetical protein HYY02_06515 [Chloroflexi bacterium]|nr:hypothetical protein [Chloroflexota bacterium]